jgi:hypothetical protein
MSKHWLESFLSDIEFKPCENFTVTLEDAVETYEKVIQEHSQPICNALGIPFIRVETTLCDELKEHYEKGNKMPRGCVLHDALKSDGIYCLKGVYLIPETPVDFVYPSKDVFEKATLELLAHELKHVHQLVTGAYKEKTKFAFHDFTSISLEDDVHFYPYHSRWVELDANMFGEWYVSGEAKGRFASPPGDFEMSPFERLKIYKNRLTYSDKRIFVFN